MTNLHWDGPRWAAPVHLLRLALLLLAWPLALSLQAQGANNCTMACNGSPAAPMQVTVGPNCQVKLATDHILEAPQACPGAKTLTVRDSFNVVVVTGTDSLSFNASAYIGQTLSVTIRDQASQLFCNGFIWLADHSAPIVTSCPDAQVSCVGDTSVAQIGMPLVVDNCSAHLAFSYTDTYTAGGCLATDIGIITRSWIIGDGRGNTTTCAQEIRILRPALSGVAFPNDISQSCDLPVGPPTQAGAGLPMYDGKPINNASHCGLTVSMTADTVYLCGQTDYQVFRHWTVMDQCSGFKSEHTQSILVRDAAAPTITCPPAATVNVIPGQCTATVTLPNPTITDNCDPSPAFAISTSFGTVGNGPHAFVPAGIHTIQYLTEDACGNTAHCTTTLTVRDQQPPVAACDDQILVSIPNGSIGLLHAYSINEGSTDFCANQVYFKAKKQLPGSCDGINGDDSPLPGYQEWFDDQIRFCCNEFNADTVRVTLRVYDIDPGPGPVNPTREILGGNLHGRFTDCFSTVRVMDAAPPVVQSCPPSVTVSCGVNPANLGQFGLPVFIDNCGANLSIDSTRVQDLNDCGVGTITRSWTATDAAGNSASCSHTITTVNNTPFTAANIRWPENYQTTVCGGSLDPDDLPAAQARPLIQNAGCNATTMTYSDNMLATSFPACYRIFRTWTVVDLCAMNGSGQGSGIYTHVQTLRAIDNTPPVFNCLQDLTLGMGSNCGGAQVTLAPVTVQDCSNNVLITNNSPYASNGGANASGSYPLGETIVTFTASDQCGNTATCTVKITVIDDTPPEPICIVGLSVSLQNNLGTPSGSILASVFDGGTMDNCTPSAQLVRTIRKGNGDSDTPPTTDRVTFNCSDVGTRLVEVWFKDAAGNSDFCVTYVSVQDNSLLCPAPTTGTIAGRIHTPEGDNTEDVTVNVSSMTAMSDGSGQYTVGNVPTGQNYSVLPARNDDLVNGVSTMDLILITRHILGIQPLGTPYKIIAADVDRSNSISTLDLIYLRRAILGMDMQFPNNNTSWRFIRASFVFPVPIDPFSAYFPELFNINNFSQNQMNANFVAVKVGDVNSSAVPNNLGGVEQRSQFYGEVVLDAEDIVLAPGQTVTVAFKARNLNQLPGYQFTIGFDPEALRFEEVLPGNVPGMTVDNFGVQAVRDGYISTSWHQMGSMPDTDESVLFSLRFASEANAHLSDLLTLNSDKVRAEAYDADGNPLDVVLNFIAPSQGPTATPATGFELYQNRPNPFSDETIIPFQLPEAGTVRLSVYDMAGKNLYTREAHYPRGYNEVRIAGHELTVGGILYYRLEAGAWKDTKKMTLHK